MVLQKNGNLCFMVDCTTLLMSLASIIHATADEGCSLFIFTAGSYSSVAIQTLRKGTMDFLLLSTFSYWLHSKEYGWSLFPVPDSLYPWKALEGVCYSWWAPKTTSEFL